MVAATGKNLITDYSGYDADVKGLVTMTASAGAAILALSYSPKNYTSLSRMNSQQRMCLYWFENGVSLISEKNIEDVS